MGWGAGLCSWGPPIPSHSGQESFIHAFICLLLSASYELSSVLGDSEQNSPKSLPGEGVPVLVERDRQSADPQTSQNMGLQAVVCALEYGAASWGRGRGCVEGARGLSLHEMTFEPTLKGACQRDEGIPGEECWTQRELYVQGPWGREGVLMCGRSIRTEGSGQGAP